MLRVYRGPGSYVIMQGDRMADAAGLCVLE